MICARRDNFERASSAAGPISATLVEWLQEENIVLSDGELASP
jgi:hypothetical protein